MYYGFLMIYDLWFIIKLWPWKVPYDYFSVCMKYSVIHLLAKRKYLSVAGRWDVAGVRSQRDMLGKVPFLSSCTYFTRVKNKKTHLSWYMVHIKTGDIPLWNLEGDVWGVLNILCGWEAETGNYWCFITSVIIVQGRNSKHSCDDNTFKLLEPHPSQWCKGKVVALRN